MKYQIADANIPPDQFRTLEPLSRQSVEDRVADALRELIVTGELPEGTPLVQRHLASRLGVSQTPIRLGLTKLVWTGFVEVGETGRAIVRRLTREDFEEIYAARFGLEGLAALAGAAAVGSTEIGRMRALLNDLKRSADEQDVDAYLRDRWEFHVTCYRASGRMRLVGEVERLFWRAERYNRLVLSSRERFVQSVQHYQGFMHACERRDGLEAESTIHRSVRWAVASIANSLPTEG